MASTIGPDGGMSARQAQMQSLRYTGEWNSKTAEDYIKMVKKELQRQHITVDSAMEKKMIDKMIQDKIPRSSIEYILKKAATNTIFYLPQEVAKSPLEHHMDTEAEKRYNPSAWGKEHRYNPRIRNRSRMYGWSRWRLENSGYMDRR